MVIEKIIKSTTKHKRLYEKNFRYLQKSLWCPKCKSKTRISYKTILPNIDKTYFSIVNCNDCNRLSFLHYGYMRRDGGGFIIRFSDSVTPVELLHTYPSNFTSNLVNIPSNIADFYLEGIRCLNSNAPNGAVALFRRALSLICIDLGADSNQVLNKQIEILPDELKPTAHEIRSWGNLGVHEDKSRIIDAVPINIAKYIKEFLEQVFFVIYDHPSKIKKLQKERKGS